MRPKEEEAIHWVKMTSSILFPFAPFALLSTVFASPVFDSIDILEINSFSSRLGLCPQKIPIRRRQVVFTHSLSPTMNGGITKPVIMDVVQYEGVNSPDCTSWQRGNREVFKVEWSHRLSCWSWWRDNKGTNRAENLLTTLFLQCELSSCWELNYSKQSRANPWRLYKSTQWILYNPRRLCPLHIGSQQLPSRVENKLKLWGFEPDLNIDGSTPIVNGRLVLRFTEYWNRWVFIKMRRCHCYKPRLLWQDVCGTCPPLFFQLIKGGVGCHHIWENGKNTEYFKWGIWIKWNCIKIASNCGWSKWCLVERKMLLYR